MSRRDGSEEQTVTSVLEGSAPAGVGQAGPAVPPRRLSWFARDPAWPIVVTLAGWPAWWALGIGNHIFTLMAIPMIRYMYRARAKGGRSIRVPPGFGIWILFLIVTLASVAEIAMQAPGTIQSSVGNRVLAWLARSLDYGGVTVFLLYAGNLTEKELPRRRLAGLLGIVGIFTVAGGMLGVIAPHFRFTSPLAKVLPASFQAALSTSLNPGASQVMNTLGYSTGRVKAPFTFTNMWGNALAILIPWLIVAWLIYGTRVQRRVTWFVLGIALVPVAFSLDRGLWVGLGVSVIYLAVRFATQGRLALLGALCGLLALTAIIYVASPLGTLIQDRLNHPKSNDVRTSASLVALQDGAASPLLGFGDTRRMQGGTQSITTGRNSSCKKCGNIEIGGNGQLQLLLITSGFAGAILYGAFFLYLMWRYRRDKTPYGMAGELVLLLGFVFMPVYIAAGPPLGFTMLAVAILWKNDRELRNRPVVAADAPVQESRPALRADTEPRLVTRALAP
jgi:hypothetical protein